MPEVSELADRLDDVRILAAVVLAVFGVALLVLRRGAPKAYSARTLRQYSLVGSILNKSERDMVAQLRRRFSPRLHICPKVRLEDVIGVRSGMTSNARRQALRGRVKSRHFDAVVTDRNGRPLAAVEFDGPSHGRFGVRSADRFKDRLCAQVGLPLFRISYRRCIAQQVSEIRF